MSGGNLTLKTTKGEVDVSSAENRQIIKQEQGTVGLNQSDMQGADKKPVDPAKDYSRQQSNLKRVKREKAAQDANDTTAKNVRFADDEDQ